MEFKYNNVLIWGYGVSGRAVEKVLIDLDKDYTILDENAKITGGGFIGKISKKDILNFDLIVLSPGVDIYRKEIVFAREKGIEVVSEIEFGYMFLDRKTKVIAVTGTNGKTTTVSMICNLLKLAGKKVAELGNIGNPFSEIYKKNFDFVVVELSSFQLELCMNFRANISIILNIAPDHIDRHKSYENYVNAKLNILKNLQKNDVAIINQDCDYLLKDKEIIYKKYLFSMNNNKTKYSCLNSKIFKARKEVLDLQNFSRVSSIFYQDILAVYACLDNLQLDVSLIGKLLQEYKFLSHRCEFVTKINNIEYFNDSKATNVHSVEWCVNNINKSNILLLLGGQNKGLDFKEFIINLNKDKVIKIIAFGKAKNKIYGLKKFNKDIKFNKEKNLKSLLNNLDKYLDEVETVVLSPGCASFDEFDSYIARGDYYKKSVLEYGNSHEKDD